MRIYLHRRANRNLRWWPHLGTNNEYGYRTVAVTWLRWTVLGSWKIAGKEVAP